MPVLEGLTHIMSANARPLDGGSNILDGGNIILAPSPSPCPCASPSPSSCACALSCSANKARICFAKALIGALGFVDATTGGLLVAAPVGGILVGLRVVLAVAVVVVVVIILAVSVAVAVVTATS